MNPTRWMLEETITHLMLLGLVIVNIKTLEKLCTLKKSAEQA
jgi:hypothetical protein